MVSQNELKRFIELQQMALDFAREGNTIELKKMIEAGLNVNLADSKGNTLLMLASYNGNYETTKMLLELNADTEKRNDRNQTPLGGVAFKGYTNIADLLIKYKADVNADQGGGKTPLMFAAVFGNKKMCDLLITNGAKKQKILGMDVMLINSLTSKIKEML